MIAPNVLNYIPNQIELETSLLPKLRQALTREVIAQREVDFCDLQETSASIQFQVEEALLDPLQRVLLMLYKNRRKEHVRAGLLLRVEHPQFPDEALRPLAVQRTASGALPTISIRGATAADNAILHPDDRNAVRSFRATVRRMSCGFNNDFPLVGF